MNTMKSPLLDPKMAVEAEPTKHWCKKMRSVFRPWDIQAGSKGYVTLEDFKNRARASLEKFPEMGDEKSAMERVERHWRDHCNCGIVMPKGYRLTADQYVQNMWWKIHQPSFEEELKEAATVFMKAMDKENKGHFNREEAKEVNAKLGRDQPHVNKVLEHLDKDNTGRITFEQAFEAQKFFFLDKESEDHPLNHIYGPLAD